MAESVPTESTTTHPTSYLVLRQTANTSGGWDVVQEVDSAGAAGAIRACVSKLAPSDQAGVFVAVPARSWRPTKVAPKTTVQLELTEVKP